LSSTKRVLLRVPVIKDQQKQTPKSGNQAQNLIASTLQVQVLVNDCPPSFVRFVHVPGAVVSFLVVISTFIETMPFMDDPTIHASKSTIKRVLLQIKDGIDSEVNRATVFEADGEDELLKFHRTELKLGRVLGRGGFCVVHELESIQLLLRDDDDEVSEISNTSSMASLAGMRRKYLHKPQPKVFSLPAGDVDVQSRRTMSQALGKSRISKYCVKNVDPKLFDKDPATYLKGTIDIALEAKFLSSMQHPNIVSIKAVSASRPDQELGYFIILDRLFELLSKRLNTWMQQYRATQGMTGFITRGKKRANKLLLERLMVALDISNAMSYIHSRGVVFRDLVR
jgi:Protein tyrosine and serine/threonine kinase